MYLSFCFRFAAKFNEIFQDRSYLLQLSKLDEIMIDGKPGRMFIYLRASSVGEVSVHINTADFQKKLISMMRERKRSVPIGRYSLLAVDTLSCR